MPPRYCRVTVPGSTGVSPTAVAAVTGTIPRSLLGVGAAAHALRAGPATRTGANDIVVLELEQVIEATAAFVASPDLGHREE